MKRIKRSSSQGKNPYRGHRSANRQVSERLTRIQEEARGNYRDDQILIITLANSVHEEDGLGTRVSRKFRELKGLPPNVDILDQHTDLLGLGYRIRNSRRVLVVDVFLGQNQNGCVHVIPREDLSAFRGCCLSARQLPAVESLELLLTVDPNLERVEIYLLLIEICTIKAAPELPTRFEGSVHEVIEAALRLIAKPFKELPPIVETRRTRSSSHLRRSAS